MVFTLGVIVLPQGPSSSIGDNVHPWGRTHAVKTGLWLEFSLGFNGQYCGKMIEWIVFVVFEK
jgi:hypothetical protein